MKFVKETLVRGVAIGNFDGVHRGHQLLVGTLMEECRRRHLFPAVFMLDRHPLELVDPARAPGRLMSADEKRQALAALGPDVFTIRFDEDTRRMTSFEYMQRLRDTFGAALIVVGYDNRFGSDRQAGVADYVRHGATLGMTVIEAPCLPGVSSSAIRRMLLSGDVASAAGALGCRYSIGGSVVHGQGRGAALGFPTANLQIADPLRLVPAGGVYAALAALPDGSRYPAMVNIGACPTFGNNERTIEASLLGFGGDLYGQRLTLEFARRIRDERKMESAAALVEQLKADRRMVESMSL